MTIAEKYKEAVKELRCYNRECGMEKQFVVRIEVTSRKAITMINRLYENDVRSLGIRRLAEDEDLKEANDLMEKVLEDLKRSIERASEIVEEVYD